ncbi:glycoside hydrolase family 12 protein [Mixia osmundae IAM 14324]|uniref:Glycoside hydrolase family 12 protein n=1 Tax=Mixia osmundae (strain CBS 9802 / IAM 14324 / JCM 22182 / KY 12970) TaxID=764103 RepID=G7E7N8_MIXOS|nr:glycoside hydrolase family 12 protein [Mixia osmundae IAM 14324]KEI38448.1 glycoside hydrolase family 12 protein [Mixia osmundae IAM 14324]GAA98848.1 hypothetical protein E5Q_05536 [Mixia osmundae IAM 14324]
MLKLSLFTVIAACVLAHASSAALAPTRMAKLHKRFGFMRPALLTLNAQYAQQGDLCNGYELSTNQWGMHSGTGHQSAAFHGCSEDGGIVWSTDWQWSGNDDQVKTYSNVQKPTGNRPYKDYKTLSAAWQWHYAQSSAVSADVSFDIFFSTTSQPGHGVADAHSKWEIMIWLSKRGPALPAGKKVAEADIKGTHWQVWLGNVENWQVLTFLNDNNSHMNDFNASLMPFIQYGIDNYKIDPSLILSGVQAGTEPFRGSALLYTSRYQLDIE